MGSRSVIPRQLSTEFNALLTHGVPRVPLEKELISENQLIEDEFEDYLDDVVINFKEPPTTSNISDDSTVPEPEKISNNEAMLCLTKLKDHLQSLGELSMSGMHGFSEFENVLLKRKVDEKSSQLLNNSLKKMISIY